MGGSHGTSSAPVWSVPRTIASWPYRLAADPERQKARLRRRRPIVTHPVALEERPPPAQLRGERFVAARVLRLGQRHGTRIPGRDERPLADLVRPEKPPARSWVPSEADGDWLLRRDHIRRALVGFPERQLANGAGVDGVEALAIEPVVLEQLV